VKTTPNPKATKNSRGEELPLPLLFDPLPLLIPVGDGVGVGERSGVVGTMDVEAGGFWVIIPVGAAGSLGRGEAVAACLTNIRAPSNRALLINVILPAMN